jgi:uncharacterized protein (DUF4415 family)
MEVLPKETVEAIRRYRGQRGPQKAPTKALISLRLDREVVDALRSTGRGWQTRANEALRAYAEKNGARAARPVRRASRKRKKSRKASHR